MPHWNVKENLQMSIVFSMFYVTVWDIYSKQWQEKHPWSYSMCKQAYWRQRCNTHPHTVSLALIPEWNEGQGFFANRIKLGNMSMFICHTIPSGGTESNVKINYAYIETINYKSWTRHNLCAWTFTMLPYYFFFLFPCLIFISLYFQVIVQLITVSDGKGTSVKSEDYLRREAFSRWFTTPMPDFFRDILTGDQTTFLMDGHPFVKQTTKNGILYY